MTAGQSFFYLINSTQSMEPAANADEKTYTLDEVSQHKDAKSLWIAIADDVYDVTPFMEEVTYGWSGLKCEMRNDVSVAHSL